MKTSLTGHHRLEKLITGHRWKKNITGHHPMQNYIPHEGLLHFFADYVNFLSASNLPAHVYGQCSPVHQENMKNLEEYIFRHLKM